MVGKSSNVVYLLSAYMIGLKRGIVKLLPYNPVWTIIFEEEKRRLKEILKDLVIDIQHIGSTSIPGMPSKPIIDLSVGISSMKQSEAFIALLQQLGYEYRPDFGGPNIQLLFVKGPENKRTHYLHLMKYGGSLWRNDLAFRDYLRKNNKAAEKYAKLKVQLAQKYPNDRKTYTASKVKFIHSIIKKSKNSLSG